MGKMLFRNSGWACTTFLATAVSAMSPAYGSATPLFLGDNNTSVTSLKYAYNFTKVDEHIYFAAYGPFGDELYRTDGTPEGTSLVKDIVPGPGGSEPEGLTGFKGEVFFFTENGVYGEALWKSDGTDAGTTLVADIEYDLYPLFDDEHFTTTTDYFYFTARNQETDENYLYKCDGTSATIIEGISPYSERVLSDGTLAYFTNVVNEEYSFWRTDGTVEGTFMIAGPSSSQDFPPYYGAVLDGLFYFSAAGAIYNTDGTTEGTSLVWQGNLDGAYQLTTSGNQVFFLGSSPDTGQELWKTDGTDAGTTLVKDITPFGSSYPTALTDINGTLYFFVQDPPSLWKSDGTEAGTVKIADLDDYHYDMVAAGGKIFSLTSSYSPTGAEILVSDGTQAGTYVIDLVPGPGSSWAGSLAGINGYLYFSAENGAYSGGINKMIPADESIVTIRTDSGAAANFGIENVTPLGDKVYFSGYNAVHGWEPWVSDGTPEGTFMLVDSYPGPGSSDPESFIEQNGRIYFFAGNENFSQDFYSSDGTSSGTTKLSTLTTEYPPRLYGAAGLVFFGEWENGEYNLWRSNGTPSGTWIARQQLTDDRIITVGNRILIETQEGGLVSYDPLTSATETIINNEMLDYIYAPDGIVLNNHVYFVHNTWTSSFLYKSDGTAAGTETIMELVYDFWIHDFIKPVGGRLFFVTATGDEMSGSIEYDLWVTDGDNEIMLTSLPAYTDDSVLQVAALGSSFIFSGSDEANGEELWITDATGTTGTTILKDINPGVSGSRPSLFVPGEAGTLYFTAHTDATGVELWKTDGTPAGTTMVADLNPGPASSMTVYDDYEEDLNWMLYRENQLLFMADNGSKGHELWLIPAPGQQPELVEIEPGPAGSTPSNFHLLDDTAVFSAWTSNTGLDLWAMPLGHAASVGDWNLY